MTTTRTPPDRVTDAEIARMVVLRGLGYKYTEIATHCNRSTNTVSRYLTDVETRAKAAGNPYEVFGEIVEDLFTVEATILVPTRDGGQGGGR